MSDGRFTTLPAETMTTEQKRVAEAIQSGSSSSRSPRSAMAIR